MRKINVRLVREAVKGLSLEANTVLRKDILGALKKAYKNKSEKRAKNILKILLENAGIAAREKRAICQDTGLPVVDLEIGQDVSFVGGDLNDAITQGVKDGYSAGYFRKSVVEDPITRKKINLLTPPVTYMKIVAGNKVRITVAPKGFGSENKSRIKMFKPTAAIEDIMDFIVETVKLAGPDACPPYVIGVGIGGTFDKAALLSKKALFLPVNSKSGDKAAARLQKAVFKNINKLNIGPMGLGGSATCLGVNILTAPTHIAGLPVSVNVSCHATRSAAKVI